MPEIKITKNYFLFEGNKYFRGNASAVRIAAYGEKKGGSVAGNAHLEPEGRIKRSIFASKVRHVRKIDINWSRDLEADVELAGKFKYLGLDFKGSQEVSFEKAKTMKLVLHLFTIDGRPLQEMLNGEARAALDFLRNEGAGGRVASTVAIATTAELTERLETAVQVSASVSDGSDEIELVVSGRNGTSTSVELDRGTFAYSLQKVKDWTRGKEKIENLESDYYGTS